MAIPPTQSDTLPEPVEEPQNSAVPPPATPTVELNAPVEFVPDWVPTADSPPVHVKKPSKPTSAARRVAKATGTEQVDPIDGKITTAPLIVVTEDPSHAPQPPKPAGPQPLPEDVDDEEEELELADVIHASPPWMVSLAFHLILMLALALLTLPQLLDGDLELNMAFADRLGEQVDQETFSFDALLDENQFHTQVDMASVEDPLASPNSDLLEIPDQLSATAPFETPAIGLALTGREQGMKNTLLLAYGGDQNTEIAVYRALEWLRRNQQKDGSWRLDGPYSNGSSGDYKNRLAATSMALLAFQGAGFTHQSTRAMINEKGAKIDVDYRKVIRQAWKKMLIWQSEDGCFYRESKVRNSSHRLYSQAQATIAICELYGMTRDEAFRRPAQRAVNFCCKVQDRDGQYPDGGWKYEEGRESDTSVTGWFVMALQSARMAGLDVPSDVFQRVSEFLDSVSDEGSFYSYMPGSFAKPALTAEGLLCRQYLGWNRDDPRLVRGVEYLLDQPIDWADTNTYYWYYATQVMHHMEGDFWFDWNEVMKREIPKKQVAKGPEAGSWSPANDVWGRAGGRLYMTCLCTYMLEVYYRHLPIYASVYDYGTR